MTKRFSALALVLVLCLGGAMSASAATYLGVATGSTAGTYYALGGDIAALWSSLVADVEVTAQSTGGSKANILLINEGGAEIAFAQNDVMAYAYAGDADFFNGEVVDSFSALGTLYPELVQIVVAADSDIKTVADLKGKQVSVGAIGSGVYFNAVQILGKAGLTLDDIKPQYLSFDESSTAFQNKQIDASFITAGLPNPSIIEVSTKIPVRLLSLEPEMMEELTAEYPYYFSVTVPAGTYAGIEEDVSVPSVSSVLIVSNSLSEDLVYELTKALFDNVDLLTHAKKAEISAEAAVVGVPVPFHPGAAKYFAEKGLID
ncbi:MAG: TAXI family TRAP transporter solute-binding subunit [Oscillospiraceae bacterium]|jgi:TRAP transporter TAXI family solute receptor|nr:TAXI family TRAP transporter solute-binding subunit [Oscillospiraceae bacterium]